jgi:lysophospholipase L1-like esterase
MKKTMTIAGVTLFIAIYASPFTTLAQGRGQQWVGSWATAAQATAPLDSGFAPLFGEGFNDQTIRNITHTSLGGSAVRVRLTNAYGTQPVTFNAVYVGLAQAGASLVPGSNRALTFRGNASVTVPAGAEVFSDCSLIKVPSDANLAISLFAATPTGTPTIHLGGIQTTYVAAGNLAASEDGSAFTSSDASWYFVDGVDVLASPRVKGAIVAIGDSITQGDGSTLDANRRWPNYLARRFLAGPPGLEMSVLDVGIGANRVLNDSPCFGVSAANRVDEDVLNQTGVRKVILMEGVADIGFPNLGFTFVCLDPNPDVSPSQIIAGYGQIIAKVHARGLKIIGGTLTPFKGAFFGWTPELEAKREAINDFIKQSGEFDGVIDFASVVADPNDPTALAPQFNSGDNLHPNDAGYNAMANAIDLSQFLPRK